MPIGADVYGRLFNVIGDTIDGLGNLPRSKTECQFTVKLQFEDLSTVKSFIHRY
jgi:F-type H+-transporting ATPase subunit beta